jgi:hypothetical protein
LFGYKSIIFYTSRDTTKLAFLTLAVLKVGHYEFWLFLNWLIWRLGVLTLAELNFGLFETG